MNCACRSVANPGNGSVSTSTALSRPPLRRTTTPSFVRSISTPAASIRSSRGSMKSLRVFASRTSPPAMAAATA